MSNKTSDGKVSGIIERILHKEDGNLTSSVFWDVSSKMDKGFCKSYPFNPLQNL